jgi:hypothetical protein
MSAGHGLPWGGLGNEEAAKRCGFRNRLDWAGFKRRCGVRRQLTRNGMRFVITRRLEKAGRAFAQRANGTTRDGGLR